jgi:hypothetical protein
MIVSNGLPLIFFQSIDVKRAFYAASGNAELKFPAASTLRRRVFELKEDYIGGLERELHDVKSKDSKISLQVDGWSTKTGRISYFAIVAHWIDVDMIWHEALLAFTPTYAQSTGSAYSGFVQTCLDDYQISGRIRSITADNASNNGTMSSALNREMQNIEHGNKILLVPCLSHVIQLAQGELLRGLKCTATNEEIERNWKEEDDSNLTERQRKQQSRVNAQRQRKENSGFFRNQRSSKSFADKYGTIPLTLYKVCGNYGLGG